MKLKNDFLFVRDSKGNTYFGGNQNWYKREIGEFYTKRACGTVAFVNSFLYQTRDGEIISRREYDRAFLQIFPYIKPQINGIPTMRVLSKGAERAMADMGYYLEYRSLIIKSKADKEEVYDFIKNSLEEDLPLLMVNWQSLRIKFLRHHWVTINEAYEISGKRYLGTSSWGRRIDLDFDIWFKQFSLMKGLWSGKIVRR